jgi:hypothetical protein
MPLLTSTHTCLLIDTDDLVVSYVRTSPTGVSTARGPRFEAYLASQHQRREQLDRADNPSAITLVVPGAWCASRPMPLSITRWARARAEIAASIDSLFPFSPDDALLEYITCSSSSSTAADQTDADTEQGVLVAVSRAQLAPWIEQIQRDFGKTPDRIVSTHAALPGLGLQDYEATVVLEPDAVGAATAHSLCFGAVQSIDEPTPTPGVLADQSVYLFPSVDQSAHPGASVLDPHDIAAGVVIADYVAPGNASPFVGKRVSPLKQMSLPAAIAAAAVIIMATASSTAQSRLRSGLESLRAEQAALQPQVDEIQTLRANASLLARNTEHIRSLTADTGEPMLSILAAGHTVLPDDGFMYRARFTPASIELLGQCPDVGGLLREIEASSTFTEARRLSPSAQIESGGSTFDIAARVISPPQGAAR